MNTTVSFKKAIQIQWIQNKLYYNLVEKLQEIFTLFFINFQTQTGINYVYQKTG